MDLNARVKVNYGRMDGGCADGWTENGMPILHPAKAGATKNAVLRALNG